MKNLLRLQAFMLLMLCVFVAGAQTPVDTVKIVPNLNATDVGHAGRKIIFNDTMYFIYIGSNGKKNLAKYNGNNTFTVIPNPNTADQGFSPGLIVYKNAIYSPYSTTDNTVRWAKYDGTSITTFSNPDAGSGLTENNPVVFNDTLYSRYLNAANRAQLSKFDGTTLSLIPNPTANSDIRQLSTPIIYKNSLYVYYDSAFGTASFKGILAKVNTNSLSLYLNPSPGYIGGVGLSSVILNDTLYLPFQDSTTGGGRLLKFDGTTLKVINNNVPSNLGTIQSPFVVYNNSIFYTCITNVGFPQVQQIAKYDGTTTTTTLVNNLGGAPGNSFIVFQNSLYGTYTSATEAGLLKYNGSNLFTRIVDTGSNSSTQLSMNLIFNDKISLRRALVSSAVKYELSFFDGSSFSKVANKNTTDIGPLGDYVIYKNNLFFTNTVTNPFGIFSGTQTLGYVKASIASQKNVTQYGGNDGWAKVTPPPCGTGSNTFLWTPGNQTSDSIGGLTAGNYSVRIICGTDTVNQAFTITQPALVCPSANRVYVNAAVATSGNGSTWGGAYKTFTEALLIAKNCTAVKEIWVAKGTYYPVRDPLFGFPANNRDRTFFITDSLKVYGGFAGTETSLGARSGLNETILSGDFNNDDVVTGSGSTLSITGTAENAYHVVTSFGINGAGVTVDGFTIKGGNADSSGVFEIEPSAFIAMQQGGGAYIYGGNNTLSNNKFINNSSLSFGAGFYCSQDQGFLSSYINNNVVKNNRAYKAVDENISDGGGAAVNSDTAFITNNTFDGNYALNSNGGFVFGGQKVLFSNNIITGNYAANGYAGGAGLTMSGTDTSIVLKNFFENNSAPLADGGALRLQGTFTVTNNVFDKNTANRGGALFARTADLINNTFYKNTAAGTLGGGYFILSASRGAPTGTGRLFNNIFYKNIADGDERSFGADIAVIDSSTTFRLIAQNNMMQSDSASYAAKFGSPSSLNIYQQNPLFADTVNAAGADNFFGTADDGLIVTGASPAINSGLNSLFPSTDSSDIKNAARIQDSVIDRGAYETTAKPVAASPQTLCSSGTVADLTATGTNIRWYRNATGDTALAAATALVAGTYYVSQTAAGLESPRTAVTVNLQVTALPVADTVQHFCGTVTVDDLAASGTTIKWYRAVAGSNPQTFTLQSDTSTLNATDTLYVTQTLNGCESVKKQVFVFSRQTPGINAVRDTLLCNGVPSGNFIFTSNQTVSSYTWAGTSAAIGLAISGTGNLSSFTTKNTLSAPINDTIRVTPVYAINTLSCSGTAEEFIITVNPTATINTIANKTVCNNGTVTAIHFSSPATGGTVTYSWTNNNTAIGLSTSGADSITGFTATNTTNAPKTATITVTPSFENDSVSCTGTSQTFSIVVNPTVVVDSVSNQVLCSGKSTAVNFSSATTGGTIVYNWTATQHGTGIAASGTGNIGSFITTNNDSTAISDTVTVIPSYTNGGLTCQGAARTFTIKVNPTAVVNAISSQTLCTGQSTMAVNFTGSVAGASYAWVNNSVSIGLGAAGTGNIPSFKAINSNTASATATITVTPNTTAGCAGVAKTFTYTVDGLSVAANSIATPALVLCDTNKVTSLRVVGGALANGAQWKWYKDSCNGTAFATGAVVNNLLVPVTTTFYVRAEGACNKTACASITIKVAKLVTLVRQHWNDVLFFDNSDNNFVQWQWYKNDVLIPGATLQYYSENNASLNGTYYVAATDKNGNQILTCPLACTAGAFKGIELKTSPNPVMKGQAYTVVSSVSAADLQGAVLTVKDIFGATVTQNSTVSPVTNLQAPNASGMYVVTLLLRNGQRYSVTMVVI